ncbi:hypothetical protein Ga0609869_000734 [Rhodovulum iodosum]|uniref:ASPIC/UnbV domain-containing protein n=1 Tax=Rhodovulum iodosum TaxID=68291 RepID=A0ABV3XPX2_9RHOB|nr:CRTAC1 family protein [Rhodovulum robiginosum]RSK31342.1 CRTAC1 family protein [Rhodovulum robiginosum]
MRFAESGHVYFVLRRLAVAVAGLAFLLAGGAAAQTPHFVERAAALGIEHRYTGGWEHFVGGGLAAFDCDDDGLPELFAAGGTAPAVLLRNRTPAPGAPLDFIADTPAALRLTGVTGAYPLDIDGDGPLDLVVLRVGGNRVLRGASGCRFADVTEAWGIAPGTGWTTAFSATWEAGAVRPTLAFGNYVDRDDPKGPFGTCDGNRLIRPTGARYGHALPLEPGFCALSMLFSDWGRQGRADLRISNDRHYYVKGGEEQMWAMDQRPRLYGPEDGWQSFRLWGMGIASRDITGDGLPEIYLSSMGDQRLQMLVPGAGGPVYRDAPYDRGTTAHRPYLGDDGRPSTGWHVAFGDVQNDGRDDIFVAKGNVDQMPSNAIHDPNNLLIQAADGRFDEAGAAAGIASLARSRGAALVDLNRDGRLDLAVVNRRAPMEIYENRTDGTGHWLAVALASDAPNTRGVGAWVEVEAGSRVQAREITVGGGHAGGLAGPEHFGLGAAQTARVRVIWPDGTASGWAETGVNRAVTVAPDGTALALR